MIKLVFYPEKLPYSISVYVPDELIRRVDNKSDETALSPDDECLICVTRRACVQSYPCGHKLLCEKCFIKLLQVNYSQGKYPLTCIFCRSPVALFKRHESPSAIIIKKSTTPPGSEARLDCSSLSTNNLSKHLPRTSIVRPGYL
uniref:RING-type domain-containing protein n=1 Tax=Romanomermis culicivorax TaxID=13658 RepID=A0A915JKU2_ROMCU